MFICIRGVSSILFGMGPTKEMAFQDLRFKTDLDIPLNQTECVYLKGVFCVPSNLDDEEYQT